MSKLLCAAALKVRINEDFFIPKSDINPDDCFTFYYDEHSRPWPLNQEKLIQVFRQVSYGMYSIQDLPSKDTPLGMYRLPDEPLIFTILHNIFSNNPNFNVIADNEVLIYLQGCIPQEIFMRVVMSDMDANEWYPIYTVSNMQNAAYVQQKNICNVVPENRLNLDEGSGIRAEQIQRLFKFGEFDPYDPNCVATQLFTSVMELQGYFLD